MPRIIGSLGHSWCFFMKEMLLNFFYLLWSILKSMLEIEMKLFQYSTLGKSKFLIDSSDDNNFIWQNLYFE